MIMPNFLQKSRASYRSKSRQRHNSTTSVSEVQSEVEMLRISTCEGVKNHTSCMLPCSQGHSWHDP